MHLIVFSIFNYAQNREQEEFVTSPSSIFLLPCPHQVEAHRGPQNFNGAENERDTEMYYKPL